MNPYFFALACGLGRSANLKRGCSMRCMIALGLALVLPGLVVAGDLEETLRFYLAKSDVVVLGEFTSEPVLAKTKFASGGEADFKIAQLIKWDAPGESRVGATIKVHIVRAVLHGDDFEPEDRLPELKKGGKCILFLECRDLKPTPSYITADIWFGVQRPSPWMAKSLARIVAEQNKRPLSVPAEKEIDEFTADKVRPNVHFKDFKVDKADLLKILRDYHVTPKQDWKHGYSHVLGEDRTGTIALRDGTKIEYMVRPGGLASLTFPDSRKLFLAKGTGIKDRHVGLGFFVEYAPSTVRLEDGF